MTAPVHLLVLVAFVAAFGALFALRRRPIAGTTLVAPWTWAAVSFFSLVGVELAVGLLGDPSQAWVAGLRYAAAMTTFCPSVALLGAKRPQDRAWQWIVLSLWAILCQPAGEWMLFGGVAEIHPARFWFLVILMFIGATNGLGTRGWLAGLLYGGGQLVLLLPFFMSDFSLTAGRAAMAGSGLILVSWTLVTFHISNTRHSVAPPDRVWLDFRDAFGAVWALRILERVNTSAKMYDWPISLTWQGFCARPSSTHQEVPQVVEDSFRTLLRRFVSPEWIDERMGSATFLPPAGNMPSQQASVSN